MNLPKISTETARSAESGNMSETPSASTLPLIAGNWKMNGLKASLEVATAIAAASKGARAGIALFPPYTLIGQMAEALKGSAIRIGGQDCHTETHGAFTGDISAAMLADMGAGMVLLGHSERRLGHGEACALVAKKTQAALRAGLEPIICIGETLEQRLSGLTRDVLLNQLRDSLPDDLENAAFHIAYEPVWAIGTGHSASDEQIVEAVDVIRQFLSHRFSKGPHPHILYGGSVNAENACHLLGLEGIGGALIGGASLKADSFLKIIESAG
jgi:triosephosphate isomerase (TIM)